MPGSEQQPLHDDYTAFDLIRRLVAEQGLAHWKRYVLAFVLMGIAAACTALSAYLVGDVINEAYVHKNFPGILTISAIAVSLFMLKGVVAYGHALILSQISNGIIAANQRRMFGKVLNESIGYFADRHSSEFITKLTAGANSATQVLNLLVNAIGRDVLSVIGLVVVMVVQDPVLSIFAFLIAPPALLMLRKVIKRIKSIGWMQFTGNTRLVETLQEALQGIRIVKAFTLEGIMRERFAANVAAVEHEANKLARVASRANPMMEALGGLAVGIALVYGGYRVVETGASPGGFFSFLTAFLLAYEPAKRLARLNIDLHSALVGVRVLFGVLDSPPTEPDDDDKPALALDAARVEFSNVQFSYRGERAALRGVTFMAEPGKVTALVGPSGGGKSTILNLMLRFFEADGGTISIDGQNIAGVSRRSLREQIGYVGQDIFLFRGTVRENIAFGRPGATDAEIVAAAQAAFAHDFIIGFPKGYDTPVGEHGMQLSGGQRQRIAIARALVKDAPIILLDEATAALDSESERQVQDALEHLWEGRTTLVVAHRLHTIIHADRIQVVEDGQIVESGRHDELLRKGGRYASFYRLQLKDQEPPRAVAALASSA